MRAPGATSIRLEVHETNHAAISRYRKSGYQEFGRRARYYEDGGDALRFEKPLGRRSRHKIVMSASPGLRDPQCALTPACESGLMDVAVREAWRSSSFRAITCPRTGCWAPDIWRWRRRHAHVDDPAAAIRDDHGMSGSA